MNIYISPDFPSLPLGHVELLLKAKNVLVAIFELSERESLDYLRKANVLNRVEFFWQNEHIHVWVMTSSTLLGLFDVILHEVLANNSYRH